MKKVFKPTILYIAFFVINFINIIMLTTGFKHPNMSTFSRNLGDWFFSIIGDAGILLFLFFLSWIIFKSTRKRVAFLTTITIIFSILCLGLASFANVFSLGFSFVQLDSFQNPTQFKFILYFASYALNFIITPPQIYYFIPITIFIIIRVLTDTKHYQHFSTYLKLISLLLTVGLIITPFLSYNKEKNETIFEHTLNPLYGSSKVGLLNYYFYDLYSYLSHQNQPITESEKKLIDDYLATREGECFVNPIDNIEYCKSNNFTNLANNKNLVIIQSEAINAFVVDLVVNGVEITPNLNQLVRESRYYSNFYSSAGIGNTSDTEFSSLSSLYGNGNELTIIASHGENYQTLAKDFKQKDYFTLSMHGNIGEFYNRKEKHLTTLGFDKHYEKKDYLDHIEGDLVHDWINDKDFLKHSVEIFSQVQQPFFAYPITVVSHAPYVPSSEIPCDQLDLGNITNLSHNYLEHVHYFDQALGIFLDEMEAKGLLDNTVIALFGDHTSSLFKRDVETILNKKLTHLQFRKEMQRVPFLIYAPDIIEPGVDDTVHSNNDIYPTFANLFGLDYKYKLAVDMLSNEPTYVYSPRSLDIFFDDFDYLYPSKTVIKLNQNISNEQITTLIKQFEKHKRINDLILHKKYFA